MGEKAEALFKNGDHGSTFGGNPVVCAGAVNILSRLTDEFLLQVEKKGEYIKEKLLSFGIKDVSGKGLMIGFLADKDSGEIIKEAREKGVLLLKAKNKVRLLPPLNITYEEIDKALEVISSVL